MLREVHYSLPWHGARLSDYASLLHISTYMFLLQLSVVLADKIDTTILGYAITPDPEPAITVYMAISKPFLQIRQIGWMLAYLVMPAVASLVAARDEIALERIKYDGTRLLVGILLPLGLLAAIYARPFLEIWVEKPEFVQAAPLMRLFLIAALPLVLSVLVQMAIGVNAIKVIALSALLGVTRKSTPKLLFDAAPRHRGSDLGYRANNACFKSPCTWNPCIPNAQRPCSHISKALTRFTTFRRNISRAISLGH